MEQTAIEGAPNVDDLFGGPDEGQGGGEGAPQTTEGQQPQGETPPSPPAPSGLTREDLVSGIREVMKGIPGPQQPQKVLSPQEVDKMLNVWNPPEDFFDRFSDPGKRAKALVELRDGLILQAMTAARYMVDMYGQELQPKLSAFEGYVQNQRVAEMRGDFLEKYPSLKKYEKLMSVVSRQVEDSGYEPPSVEEGFKHLADEAVKFIRETVDPAFELTAGQTTQTQQTNNGAPRMVTTSAGRGSQGGASAPKRGGQTTDSPDGGLWD